MDYPKRVAIIRLSAMGDIIHTMASLQFMRERFPKMEIVWFVDEVFAEILSYNPQIDRVVPLPLKKLKQNPSLKNLKNIYQTLKKSGEFDLVIDVQGLIKSAIVARVLGKNIAGLDSKSAKEALATLLYRKKFGVNCKEIAPFRFATLISKALGFEITKEMLLNKKPYLFWDERQNYSEIDKFLQTPKSTILLVIGASNPSKIYPQKSWIEMVSHLRMHNILMVAGSEEERGFAREIERKTIAKLLPRLSLNELKYLISRVNLLIGNDTGPSHIAWGLNKPSILLFGSTPATMMMQTPQNIAISAKPDFRACRFDKSDMSIAQIKPEEITEQVLEILGDE